MNKLTLRQGSDENLVKDAANAGLLYRPKGGNADVQGKQLDAYEAWTALHEPGKGVVMRHPDVGRMPAQAGDWFERWDNETAERHAAEGQFKQNIRHEGVPAYSVTELVTILASEGLADVPSDGLRGLSDDEKHALPILRALEGGTPYTMSLIRTKPVERGYIQKEWMVTGPRKAAGLYDPTTRKGGVLGIGRHQDRLTAYEAAKLLGKGREVVVRNDRGEESRMSSFDALATYAALEDVTPR